MMRRRTGGSWVVLALLVATFVAEPRASLEVTADLFTAAGEFGGALVSELASDEESTVE